MGAREVEVIDAVRAYWDRRPCNIGHSRLALGSAEYFRQVEWRKYFVEPHIREFADFPRWAGKRVLEIGCGIGTDTINFARAGAEVTAVDLSPQSLGIARRRAEVFDVAERIHFVEGNAEALDVAVPVERYDLVYAFGVFHHTPDPQRAITQAGKYLGHLSELRFMVYATNSWKKAMIDCGLEQFEAQGGCPVARTFDELEIRGMLPPLATINVRQAHLFTWDVEAYIAGEYRPAPWFAAMPAPLVVRLEKLFGWHLLVRGCV